MMLFMFIQTLLCHELALMQCKPCENIELRIEYDIIFMGYFQVPPPARPVMRKSVRMLRMLSAPMLLTRSVTLPRRRSVRQFRTDGAQLLTAKAVR